MRESRRFCRWPLLSSAFLVALLAGCSGDSPLGPAVTDTGAQADLIALQAAGGHTTMGELWPNEDGRRWDYTYAGYACGPRPPVTYSTPDEVPPAPDPADVLPLLGSRSGGAFPLPGGYVLGDGCEAVAEPFALRFNGLKTTESGVTAQNLEELWAAASPQGARPAAVPAARRFLSRLAQARPDLRARLAAHGVSASAEGQIRPPLFLFGYAWEKTAEHIGTYGDVDRLLAWKFLQADIAPGSRFTHQLVPSLADDVFLHAYVVPKRDQWRLRRYTKDVQVVYLVDYGIMEYAGESGDLLGYVRPVDYGTVVYAPGVGPVLCAERFGAASDDPARTSAGNVIALQTVTPGPAPVAAAE